MVLAGLLIGHSAGTSAGCSFKTLIRYSTLNFQSTVEIVCHLPLIVIIGIPKITPITRLVNPMSNKCFVVGLRIL